VHGFVGPPHA